MHGLHARASQHPRLVLGQQNQIRRPIAKQAHHSIIADPGLGRTGISRPCSQARRAALGSLARRCPITVCGSTIPGSCSARSALLHQEQPERVHR